MPEQTGLALLPADGDTRSWNEQQKALMQACGLAGTKNVQRGGNWTKEAFQAPRDVVEAFLFQCRRTQLDPIARQIYCIERGGKWGIQLSIDGFRLVAERSKQYRGQSAPQWTGDGVVWVDVWLSDRAPAAARVGVHREGFMEPVWGIATYSGYVPRDRNGDEKPANQWLTNPANQLAKCAEMLALRKAFPQDLSNLYGTEEMDQAGRPREAARVASSAPAEAGAAPVADPATGEVIEGEIVPEEPVRDFVAEAKAATAPDQVTGIWRDAKAARVPTAVLDGIRMAAARLAKAAEAAAPRTVRDFVAEGRSATTRDGLRRVLEDAVAAKCPREVLDEIARFEDSLPGDWAPSSDPEPEPGEEPEPEEPDWSAAASETDPGAVH